MHEIRSGMSGDDVARWKRFLAREGLLPASTDAAFDDATRDATRAWQKANGLGESGVCDAASLQHAIARGLLDSKLDAPAATSEPAKAEATKAETASRMNWTVIVPVLAAMVVAAGSLFVAWYNSEANIRLEQEKLRSSLIVETLKLKLSKNEMVTNLIFFDELRILKLTDDQKNYLAQNRLGNVPGTAVASIEPPRLPGLAGTTAAMPNPPTSGSANGGANGETPRPYRVYVQFAGRLERETVRGMMAGLAQEWRMQGTALGGERTSFAAGKNEIRYRSADDRAAAEALAEDVNAAKIVPTTVKPVEHKLIAPGTLEVWISN